MKADTNLFDLTVRELLDKFGAGSHKPGSGSAVAFQGIVAIEMLKTVISLTLDQKNLQRYSKSAATHQSNREKLITYSAALEKLFHQDAIAFDNAIETRYLRNAEHDLYTKHKLARQGILALEECCSIPLQVARISYQICKIGLYTYENGFKSASGDSAVGIHGALSAMEGCLSILELNLISCTYEDWYSDYVSRSKRLKKTIHDLRLEADDLTNKLSDKLHAKADGLATLTAILKQARTAPSNRKVVAIATRELIQECSGELDDPKVELRLPDLKSIAAQLGFEIIHMDLGDEVLPTGAHQIGGQIQPVLKLIQVNSTLSNEQQRFTLAHEIGHAVLHPDLAAHRDIPLDHERSDARRIPIERQADQFAALLLMPEYLLQELFYETFGTNHLIFNEDVANALLLGPISAARREISSIRGFSREVARTTIYQGRTF